MKILLISLLIAVSSAASAQSFFKPIPKPELKLAYFQSADSTSAPKTAINAFRPVVNIASYSVPGNSLLSGAGISYQRLVFDESTQKWNAIWSVNALAWYQASLDGDNTAFAYGLAGGVLNNLILIGAATDGKKVYGTVGLGLSLNN